MKHCFRCGAEFTGQDGWPKLCYNCNQLMWANPLPVSVAIIPVITNDNKFGLIGIRRSIPPKIGAIALPGGFEEYGHWADEVVREVQEEASLNLDPSKFKQYTFETSPNGQRILLFSEYKEHLQEKDLPVFAPNSECSERVIIRYGDELAFPLQEAVVNRFFEEVKAKYNFEL